MIVDFFVFLHINVMFCFDTPLAPCVLHGLPRSSDDSHSFMLNPDFHRVEEDVHTCEGTNSTSDGSSIAASCEEHPPFPPACFSVFLVSRTVDAVCKRHQATSPRSP